MLWDEQLSPREKEKENKMMEEECLQGSFTIVW